MNAVEMNVATPSLSEMDVEREPHAVSEEAVPWIVLVWNDPVNLMSYVSLVFQKHFGYSAAKAEALMQQVHQQGRAAVFSGNVEEAERHTQAMHEYGLWATYQKADQA